MNIFFTADTHFCHNNIIKYCNRPFSSIEEMNEVLIKRWNKIVEPNDTIYHLGDFGFAKPDILEKIVKRLNGKIHLILGNHDKNLKGKTDLFESIREINKIYISDLTLNTKKKRQGIILCHYAMKVWDRSHYGYWHLYGHSHGTLKYDPNSLSMDVGVDCHNYAPISYEKIKCKMAKKNFVPIDHHE